MSFLAKCKCVGDTCTCTDFLTNQPINQTKGITNTMNNTQFADALRGFAVRGDVKLPFSKATQYSKLSEYLQSCADPDREGLIDDVIANADSLPIATLKRMSKALSAKAHAKEFSQSRKAQRLAILNAAMANEGDNEQVTAAVELARGELRRLGYNINASGPDGFNVAEMDEKMRELNWSDERRRTLKACCASIGLIEP